MDKILHHSIKLKCDITSAFRYFVDKEKLQNWLAPSVEVDPVVGGKYELFWVPEEPEYDSTIGCTITAIDQEKLLAFEWKGPKQYSDFMNHADPLTHVTVAFYPVKTGEEPETEIHLVHTGWRDTPDWEEARQWFQKAWDFAFSELEKRING